MLEIPVISLKIRLLSPKHYAMSKLIIKSNREHTQEACQRAEEDSKTNTTISSSRTVNDWRIWKPPEDFQQTQCLHIFQTFQHTRTITPKGSNTKTQSNSVYAVQCNEECPDLYIKETKQLLHKRIEGQTPQGRLQMVQMGSERGKLEHPSLQGLLTICLLF